MNAFLSSIRGVGKGTKEEKPEEGELDFDREVEVLMERFRGELILPKDREYHKARKVWNRLVDKKPALIGRCRGVNDVTRLIKFARHRKLEISVRGGGHNIAGSAIADRGVVVDLSLMRGVRVDPKLRVAFVEGGALWNDLDTEAQVFGLATSGGLISTTGVGGLSLGGGVGWLSRSFGLSCDNILSVDLITAEGEFLTASETENSEILWGIRGGGGNFGVVVGFQVKLYPVGTVLYSNKFYPYAKAREVLNFYAKFTQEIPHNLCCFFWLTRSGALIMSVYHGDTEEAVALLEPLEKLEPVVDLTKRLEYAQLQCMFDRGNSPGYYSWSKSNFFTELTENVVDSLFKSFEASPINTTVEIMLLGGAIKSKKPQDTAFYHRKANYEIHAISHWEEELPKEEIGAVAEWSKSFASALEPFSNGGGYVNINTQGSAPEKQYGDNYLRLQQLKQKMDPENIFHLNHNILPLKE